MEVLTKNNALKTIHFLRGLDDEELEQIAELCRSKSYESGQICEKSGEPTGLVSFIVKGKVGVEFHMNSIAYGNKDIVMYTLNNGGIFGWPALIESLPWATLRALEPTEVLYLNIDQLNKLCEKNNHIGYILMKNLSSLVATRLRRSRMSMLNSIVAMNGEW